METFEKTAEVYDELLVPALFDQWARRFADTVDVRSGSAVLDVACGTGVLACKFQERLGTAGSVSAIDLNPGMLAVARRKAPGIDWREGNAESLPYDDESFDVVVSQFGLMLFSSPESALREMHRVLRRGGTMSVLVFDSLRKNQAYASMAEVFGRVVGSSVGDILRYPFSMGDTEKLAVMFEEAGISGARISTHTETARFSSGRHMVLSDVRGWFPFAGIDVDEQSLQRLIDQADRVLEPFRIGDGAFEFPVAGLIVSATKE